MPPKKALIPLRHDMRNHVFFDGSAAQHPSENVKRILKLMNLALKPTAQSVFPFVQEDLESTANSIVVKSVVECYSVLTGASLRFKEENTEAWFRCHYCVEFGIGFKKHKTEHGDINWEFRQAIDHNEACECYRVGLPGRTVGKLELDTFSSVMESALLLSYGCKNLSGSGSAPYYNIGLRERIFCEFNSVSSHEWNSTQMSGIRLEWNSTQPKCPR